MNHEPLACELQAIHYWSPWALYEMRDLAYVRESVANEIAYRYDID